ncbi:MAG: peptidoglycan DD-metalloendopeptidase family protein [Bacteroidaceae bacterium]|nr:peptidoglycan DD-metalloendopeptidase family protein [Bacteroidaceae bacterium]
MRRFVSICLCLLVATALMADSKKVKELKNQKSQMERGIQRKQQELTRTKQNAVKKEQTVDFIEDQLQSRLTYIHTLERDIDTLENRITVLQAEHQMLTEQLAQRKQKYIQSLRSGRYSQNLRNPALFILSAESFPQLYRRMRYAREFAALQKRLGIQVIEQQNLVRDKQNQLLDAKQEKTSTMREVIRQRKQLATQHSIVKTNAEQLRKRQKQIEKEVAEQQKQLNALNIKIDRLIQIEIEQARKRAEAEARKKREAEERARAAKKQSATKGTTKTQPAKTTPPSKWLTTEDQKLNGNLEQNKGRLPVPITGPYRIDRRFGLTHVTASVVLDNKGVNYQGQAGAHARAVFDGEVSAVFQLGSLRNVLVRHGSYISVYCNLSSTIVTRGQKVKARDILGTVAPDDKGNFILHFQLRKETAKLNPEQWIGR